MSDLSPLSPLSPLFPLSNKQMTEIKELDVVQQIERIKQICKNNRKNIFLSLQQLGDNRIFPLHKMICLNPEPVKDFIKGDFLTLKSTLNVPLRYTLVKRNQIKLINENYNLNDLLKDYGMFKANSSPIIDLCQNNKEKGINLKRFKAKECSKNLKLLKEIKEEADKSKTYKNLVKNILKDIEKLIVKGENYRKIKENVEI